MIMRPCEASLVVVESCVVRRGCDRLARLAGAGQEDGRDSTHESRRTWLPLDEAVIRRLGAVTVATGFRGFRG